MCMCTKKGCGHNALLLEPDRLIKPYLLAVLTLTRIYHPHYLPGRFLHGANELTGYNRVNRPSDTGNFQPRTGYESLHRPVSLMDGLRLS